MKFVLDVSLWSSNIVTYDNMKIFDYLLLSFNCPKNRFWKIKLITNVFMKYVYFILRSEFKFKSLLGIFDAFTIYFINCTWDC